MPGKVTLKATSGPLSGESFEFDEPDYLVFGKGPDCRIRLPREDRQASRHHLIMEVRPPRVSVRDLGSLNGTFVNDEKIGARSQTETPEEGATHEYRNVDLSDGDQVRASKTVFTVSIESSLFCTECGREIEGTGHDVSGSRCADCRERAERSRKKPRSSARRNAPEDVGAGESDDPVAVLIKLLLERRGAVERPRREGVRRIPGYEIGKMLGKGGMGAVYLAVRESDGQQVAIKVMLAEAPAGSEGREVFEREIAVQKRLGDHPNCVPVLDYDLEGTAAYFAMEFCPGGSVDKLMVERRGDRLSIDEAAPIMLQSLEGLQHAHEHDVIHRDLKPQNILLTQRDNGVARLCDFGLAKDFELAGMSGMTRTGSVGGTPYFLPREQVTNFKYMKPDTDVCGMAATFYNMLTGQFWRDFRSGRDPINIILSQDYVPIRKRDASIPRRLAAVIDRAASDDPRKRYQTAAEFREALVGVV